MEIIRSQIASSHTQDKPTDVVPGPRLAGVGPVCLESGALPLAKLTVTRMLAVFALLSLAPMPAAALSGELQRLQVLLSDLNQEQQATQQEFQMVEQERRASIVSAMTVGPGLDPRSFEEIAADREQALGKAHQLADRKTRLLAKEQEIEARKQPVLERISQLATNPDSTP